MRIRQMQSCLHDNGTIECALREVDVVDPEPHEVLVKVEAAPINPSDLGLMFGAADLSSLREIERDGRVSILLDVPPARMRAMGPRVGQWIGVGNEGSGRVVAAGSSEASQIMLGKRVGMFGGEMYSEYRCLPVSKCMMFPDSISSEQAASCFVNPMTAMGFMETREMEGQSGIVHTAAASNLGQMLVRLCQADDIPLVNIVRSEEQVKLLRGMGVEGALNSRDKQFMSQLIEALSATEATLAFDAIGGGKLINRILTAMEIAAVSKRSQWSPYGSDQHKQIYVYGQLDLGPTELTRGFGWVWSVGGWLLNPFMNRAGPERVMRMKKRVVEEIGTTFASHYSLRIPLSESLSSMAVAAYSARKTGQKALLLMNS